MIHLKRLYVNNFKQLQEIELHFPLNARILVQGKNEAGKSTLFEAVFFGLFGAALESGARNLDALIAYETEKARVELEVQSGARVFKITRTIIRGKPNLWQLEVEQNGAAEEIRGNNVVNKRLIDELGFDGEALLNTCFVEQKKLEKLEGLNRAKREESLAKLFNLDTLVALESELKIRGEDKQDLERLRQRAELADIQFELPTRQKELSAVERKIALIELRGAVAGAVDELRAVAQLDADLRALAAKRDAAAERVERMNRLREAMLSVKDARDALERAEEAARETTRLRTELDAATRAAQDAPILQSRLRSLRRLGRHVARLERIRAAGAESARRADLLAGHAARIGELSAAVAADEKNIGALDARLKECAVGDALGEWVGAKSAQDPTTRASGIAERKAARDRITGRFQIEVFGIAALLLLFIVAAITVQPLVFAPLAIGTLGVLALRTSALWRDLARAAEELGRAEGEAQARGESSAEQATRLREAEARLMQLGVAVPDSADRTPARWVMDTRTRDELRAEFDAARERLVNARAVLGELARQSEIRETGRIAEELQELKGKVDRAQAIAARWVTRVERIAREIGVEGSAHTIQRALFQVEAQIEQAQGRARDATRLKEELARKEEQAQSLWARARAAYEQARTVQTDAAAWNPALTLDDYTAFGKELRAQYDDLGGEAALKEAREVEGELGRKQGEKETRAQNMLVLRERIAGLLGEARGQKMELRELEELRERLARMDLGDEDELRSEHRELVGRVRSLEDRQAQIERGLGLAGEALERDACRAEYAQAARQLQVRERGAEIVQAARRRVMQKVLPATMDYMQRILPALTQQRYTLAQLDDESFKIQVWDERAGAFGSAGAQHGGAWKEKNIFSGGTRDQFSLALRLAFALATLPQERGSAPSFIFLDEPLGSFDNERADALIYLLTEGEIARAFEQIFLISHVRVDERLFTNRVVMEGGRVAETDLPR